MTALGCTEDSCVGVSVPGEYGQVVKTIRNLDELEAAKADARAAFDEWRKARVTSINDPEIVVTAFELDGETVASVGWYVAPAPGAYRQAQDEHLLATGCPFVAGRRRAAARKRAA